MIVDSVEQKVLFRGTRIVALLVVLLLGIEFLVNAAVGMQHWWALTAPIPHVSRQETFIQMAKSAATTSAGSNDSHANGDKILTPLRIPNVLRRFFNVQVARPVLLSHLKQTPSEDRQDYLNNMADVVSATLKNNAHASPEQAVEDEVAAMNAYMDLKDARIEQQSARHATLKSKIMFAEIAAAILLALIGLFSLVLVLLSIERNTRRAS